MVTLLGHDQCKEAPVDSQSATPTALALEGAFDGGRLASDGGLPWLLEEGPPRRILLDIDSTDDPTYGQQEGTAYHGYYRQHMYHPLLVFDGDTAHLITALLRPSTGCSTRCACACSRSAHACASC
jgi:hypothetical protein